MPTCKILRRAGGGRKKTTWVAFCGIGADVRMQRNVQVQRRSKPLFILFMRYDIIAAFHTCPLARVLRCASFQQEITSSHHLLHCFCFYCSSIFPQDGPAWSKYRICVDETPPSAVQTLLGFAVGSIIPATAVHFGLSIYKINTSANVNHLMKMV